MGQRLGRKGDALRNMMGWSTVVEYLTQCASDPSFSVSETHLTKSLIINLCKSMRLDSFLLTSGRWFSTFLQLAKLQSYTASSERNLQGVGS